MWRYIKRVLIGKPLKTLDEGQTHLTKFKALAMLSSDAISSVAYGPEQITTVLVTLSAMAMWYSIPIAAIVLLLLLALLFRINRLFVRTQVVVVPMLLPPEIGEAMVDYLPEDRFWLTIC